MTSYQYQLIRYVHDQFTGEFINMGVILYAPEKNFLDCKVNSRYQRLNAFFPAANGRFTKQILQNIEHQIKKEAKSLQELFLPSENLSVVTQKIYPDDDSAIRLSEVKMGLDIDMEAALNYLYYEMVEKNSEEIPERISLSDDDVWKNKYKEYFDKYHISDALTSHTVNTPNDHFTFERAWKNESWHCYEPVSFYLLNKESIKDKAYKWAGRVKGLQDTVEQVHLTLLASINPEFNELRNFMDHLIEVHNDEKVMVDIVFEDKAEAIAQHIRKQMDAHNNV